MMSFVTKRRKIWGVARAINGRNITFLGGFMSKHFILLFVVMIR